MMSDIIRAMASTLTAHEQPVSRIFSNDYVFNIPSYQRPYAWTTEQAGDLIEDLLAFIGAAQGEVEEMPPYFLGSIVLIKEDGLPKADVVDGQQRLTTMTILLSAIRGSVTAGRAQEVTQLLYEKGSQILGTKDRFRLSLRERDQEFFARYVQREGCLHELISNTEVLPSSQSNIRSNAILFAERLASITENDRLQLAQFLVTRCYLVVVSTPDLDSAYRIFSVLNSRGLNLSPTDILKAEIIGGITPGQREHYTQIWEDAEEDMGRDLFAELFSHIRMIHTRSKPKASLLREFRDHVPNLGTPEKFINESLLPYAKALEDLASSSYSSVAGAEDVNESLRWLNRLEFTDWVPPALEFAVRKRQDSGEMATFFRGMERLAYSMLARRVGVNARIERFSALTSAIIAGRDLAAPSSPLQLDAMEQLDFYEALDGPFYVELAARARTSVMLRLDSLLAGAGAQYDYSVITVEHVLPQNPRAGSEWLAWFPDVQVRLSLTNRIGNLALLTRKKNSAASNFDFARKKSAYFTNGGVSPFPITTQVLSHSEWDSSIVEARQRELMAVFESHWRLQGRFRP